MIPVILVQQDQREQRVIPVILAHRAHKVIKENLVFLAQRVIPVLLVQQELREQRVIPVTLVHRGHKVIKVNLVLLDCKG